MANVRGFSRATGPSGWVERSGTRYPISGWEIVSVHAHVPEGRGWFRCTARDFDAHSGEGVHVHLRNWDLLDQELDITLARPRDGGAVWEFRATGPLPVPGDERRRAK